MRLILFPLFTLILAAGTASAQSISQNLPAGPAPVPGMLMPAGSGAPAAGADSYSVTDVSADVTADTAAHARDQALMQAERAAFAQLCARMGVNSNLPAKLSDDAVAGLVHSFEVQSEHLSAVRYIGVFTIIFNPVAVQKQVGSAATVDISGTGASAQNTVPAGPVAHVPVTVQTGSLAVWTEIRRRLGNVAEITRIDVISLGRGSSHVDLSYTGDFEGLQKALNDAG
ncbi:MAG: hypothetical protein P4M15_10320, partial [Alphaproteobacteria bacterium]|nr:hypothetical protein [Alphaproteobacteria bacterium]